MTKRERVMAALRGGEVDRPPLSFWLHNFATENSAERLAAETLLLGPDCSIHPDTPERLLHAVGAAIRGGAA